MDRLVEMETFVKVVERKSFAAAARALGVTQSRVSKSISSLERRLQTQLLLRTTRSQSLTLAGGEFFRQAVAVLAAISDAEESARKGQNEVSGRLRVNTAAMLAHSLVQPALLAFQQIHPDLFVEITVDDRRIDLVAEGVDLLVRVGELESSSLVVRKAGSAAFGFYASPAVVGAMKVPLRSLDALEGLPLIGLGRLATNQKLVVGNAMLALAAAKAHAGIAPLPVFLAEPALATGELVEVVAPKTLARSAEVSFLHGFGSTPPRRVTAFLDFAIHKWRTEKLLR